MGKSDDKVKAFYDSCGIKSVGKTALLGFTNNNWYQGELFDLSLGNWEINSDWNIQNKYDTVICTRTAFFAKDPTQFLIKCKNLLNPKGTFWTDFGLGDHFRYPNYKIGWVKNGEHEHAYVPDNFVWSTVWSESFRDNPVFKIFVERIQKFGYKEDIYPDIIKEVPCICNLDTLPFKVDYSMLTLWQDAPQLYILLKGYNE